FIQYTEFEWDPGKRAANLLKHGLDFKDAAKIFERAIFTNVDMGEGLRRNTMRKANERKRKRKRKRFYQKRPETP
ncbi:MAG: hypothetical protein ACKVKR_04775, partial [Pseudomonadales bacterium]